MRTPKEELWRILSEHPGKVLGGFFGFIIGIVVIFFGWFDAISLAICVGTGYFIGRQVDRRETLKEFLDRVLPPRER
ncbi:MAG TPA: DUF2273 domain-containing protein [Firmicutes bacterium]|nr:DUF2273 domain-containing protein [Bacillota bacterium]HHY97300.1 DUF2273 domain-containing protein [Bacillota bacterium]